MHSFTESLRIQLSSQGINVLELIPPRVQTDLMGQLHSDEAMPLEDYLDEVMTLLHGQPDAVEICSANAHFLRHAEATGNYARALATSADTQ